MLQRDVSRPYLYTAVVMISGAVGYVFGGNYGAFFAMALTAVVVFIVLLRRLRDV